MKSSESRHIIIPALGLLLLSSCGGNDKNMSTREADSLYRQSKNLIISYTNKLIQASDSTNIDSISREFDNRMTELNMKYPPGTDHYLSEDKNDTLAILTAKYVRIRNTKLGGAPKPEVTDLPAPPPAFTVSSPSRPAKKSSNPAKPTEAAPAEPAAAETPALNATPHETATPHEPTGD